MACCWNTIPIGSISETTSLSDIWNSRLAQGVRKSIHDGSFKYCRTDICPHLLNNDLPKKSDIQDPYFKKIIESKSLTCEKGPAIVQLNNDKTCNLSCPSCRTELENSNHGEIFDQRKRVFDHSLNEGIYTNIKELSITGSGDPFASKMYRELLTTIDGSKYPDLKINLFTNGVLFDENIWNKMTKIHKNIQFLRISIDAATENTYNIVRRGGDFKKLMRNLEFLSKKHEEGYFSVFTLCFVVQTHNYKEMKEFIQLAKKFYNAEVYFQKIFNWGTYTSEEFKWHAIYELDHPEHQQFLEILKDSIFKGPRVELGNLAPFVD